MTTYPRTWLAIAVISFSPQLAATQVAQQTACPTGSRIAAAPFESWQRATSVRTGAVLKLGEAARVSLVPLAEARLPAELRKASNRGGFAGHVTVQIVEGGTYSIALGDRGWIDLERGRTTLPSIAHRHGPACSGITKIVDFSLQPGSYAIQVSGIAQPSTTVMIVRAPSIRS